MKFMIKPQTLKGFRDFLPQEARKRQYVVDTLRKVFESYGFEPLETPALEYEEILTGKYGEEGDKLMYRFEDRGKRKVAMRYDQTVPLARVVAQYGEKLPMPFKRYQIQNVWRADNTQKGRYREFLQCDADIVGLNSPLADAEVIAVAARGLEELGFFAKGGSTSGGKDLKILINDRNLLKSIPQKAIASIDKLKKIGKDAVINELLAKRVAKTKREISLILESIEEKLPSRRLVEIFSVLERFGLKQNNSFSFSPTLARGLDYYTGVIFEIEINGYSAGSVCGGGRYDNLIGMFAKQTNLPAGRQVPAVGFAFGFDRLIEAIEELRLFPKDIIMPKTKVLITIFKPELLENSIQTALLLYRNKVATELYLDENASLEKQLKYADKKGIPYAIIIGPDEASKNLVTLRNMKTRKQNTIKLENILKDIY